MDIRSDNLRVVVTDRKTAIGEYLQKELDAGIYRLHECDVLIVCDGKEYSGYFTDMKDGEDVSSMVRNFHMPVVQVRGALSGMRKRGFGRIIFLSSVTPHLGVPGTSAYSAAKSALWGLTKVLAKENADRNVLINCLNLGYMDGGMTHRIKDYEKIKETIPVKKFGDFKEIANAVEFLVRSDYITGTNIEINGGLW